MSLLPQRVAMLIGAAVLVGVLTGCDGGAAKGTGQDAVEVMPAQNREQYEEQMRKRMQGGGSPMSGQPVATPTAPQQPAGTQPGGTPTAPR